MKVIVVALSEESQHVPVAEDEVLLVTGPGKVRAATALSSLLASRSAAGDTVEFVVNLGTAGALVSGLAGIVEPRHVIEHDFDRHAIEHLIGRRYPIRHEIVAARRAHGGNGGAGVTLATGDRFLTDPEHVARLRAQGAHLVDMEGAALHAACLHHNVPFRTIKYVSDEADEHAFRSWQDSVEEASKHLGEWLTANRATIGFLPHQA